MMIYGLILSELMLSGGVLYAPIGEIPLWHHHWNSVAGSWEMPYLGEFIGE